MSAAVVESIAAVRAWTAARRRADESIAFVPTMGALHQGHARLIEQARKGGGSVAVSIFVNPLQFDRQEDLERYPRTLEADVQICNDLGVDLIFVPGAGEMYPAPPLCTVEVKRLTDRLCGPFRPGHFAGVATVVTKLFQIVQPDRAYFGEKDAQQLAIIRRLVTDLNIPVEIVGVPTVREADGLALSSRNARLTREERQRAPVLYQALRVAERAIAAGETDARAVERASHRSDSAGCGAQTRVPGGGRPGRIAGRADDRWTGPGRRRDVGRQHASHRQSAVWCPGETMKLRDICKSKIHRAVVTGADLNYVGSVGIDQELLDRTDIIPGEKVSIWNVNNGERIETYAISLPRGSGQVVINGAAARHFHPGDRVIIVAFCLTDENIEPRMIAVDDQNRFVQNLVPDGAPEDVAPRRDPVEA